MTYDKYPVGSILRNRVDLTELTVSLSQAREVVHADQADHPLFQPYGRKIA